jgi:F0F1-type ATP synthase membrane subunit b/b'
MGSDNRHKHVRGARAATGRWGARGGVALLALSLLGTATITSSASATAGRAPQSLAAADDDPQRVLQSVSVGVGPDGSITGIDSTSISKTDSSDLTTADESFDPASVAGDLPVRILTSYRLGERSGTDLSEIVGESGRVEIEVVVQNTTVRPQKLTYDVDSTERSQFALVGAPLTVVATADLGEAGLARVVTDDGGNAASEAATNGVLSRGEDDRVKVQWASLLAPPRLSPSATLRLVQETESFEVPTFDVNVQPGLVTDTSVQNLLESAFSDEAGSTLRLEGRTIALIGQVTGALEVASNGLSDVEQLLDTSARTIGQRTIADLTGSSDRITTELSGLAKDLGTLNDDIDSQLKMTQSSTLSQLEDTVAAIKKRLGDPTTTPEPKPIKVTDCAFDFTDKLFGSDATVYAQLLRVKAQLTAIGGASQKCAGVLAEDLREAIGSTDPGYTCEAASEALICALGQTSLSIEQKAVDLSTVGTNVADRFDADRLLDVRSGVDDLNETVGGLQSTARGLANGSSSLDPFLERLGELQGGLTDLQAALQPGSSNGIPAQLAAINTQARIAQGSLGAGAGGGSVSQQAQDAAERACDIAAPVPAAPRPVDDQGASESTDPPPTPTVDLREEVSALLVGRTCAGGNTAVPSGYGGVSVAERADSALGAVNEMVGLSDLSDPANPVNQQLSDLRLSVGDLLTLVIGLITDDGAGLKGRVKALADRLDALGVGTDTLPSGTACPAATDDDEDALTALNRSFGRLYCKQVGLESYIADQFSNAGTVLGDVQDDLADGQEDADSARTSAQDTVDSTTEQLSKRLDKAGNALRTKGAREIAAQRRRLDTEVKTVTQLLSDNIKSAVSLIDSRVRTANGNLGESQQRLVSDLARVLTDIGSRDGSGLLGALASGASETSLANESIVRVSNTASAFRNLRSAAMEDTLLQQAQLARSLELQQELPAFGLELPAGSRFVSVFSFHVGQR